MDGKKELKTLIGSITKDMDDLPLSEQKAKELLSSGEEATRGWPGRRPELVQRVSELMVEDLTTHAVAAKRMWTDTSWPEREALAVFPLILGGCLAAYPEVSTSARNVLVTIQLQADVRAFVVGLHMAAPRKLTWLMRVRSSLKAQRMPPLLSDDKIDSYRQQAESGLCAAGVDPYLAGLAAALVAQHSSREELGIRLRRLLSQLILSEMADLEAYYSCSEDLLRYTVRRPAGVRALMVWVVHGANRALLIGYRLATREAAA